MRKSHSTDDSETPPECEAKAYDPPAPVPPDHYASQSLDVVACSSLTLPSNRKEKETDSAEGDISGKLGIDWFEIAAVIDWDSEISKVAFEMLSLAKDVAKEQKSVCVIPIGGDHVGIQGKGAGSGRDSYKEVVLSWNGVKVAISERSDASRMLSNASLVVSGAPCLILGYAAAWEFFHRVIVALGGSVKDEWIRRADLCIDMPAVDYGRDIHPLLDNQQFICRARKRSWHCEGQRPTGFSVGLSNRIRIDIYDKLYDCVVNHDAVYLAAMQQARWCGLPTAATRVEWQMGREWLKQYGIDTPEQFIAQIADVFGKLTGEIGGVFRMTAEKPDRANNRQSQVATHPLWSKVVEIGKRTIGEATTALSRLDRSTLDEGRAIRQIVGFVTSIADRRQKFYGSKQDLLRIISECLVSNKVTDEQIEAAFTKKANASGTMQALLSFQDKEAA